MPGNPGLGNKRHEIPRPIAGQGRLGEMRVLRQEIRGRTVDIGEITAPAARDTDFLTRAARMIHDQNPAPGMGGTHQPCGPGPDDQRINLHIAPCPIPAPHATARAPKTQEGRPPHTNAPRTGPALALARKRQIRYDKG